MSDDQVSRDNFYLSQSDDGSFCVLGRRLPGLASCLAGRTGGLLTRIPVEVAPNREAAAEIMPWISDGLRRAYEAGRAGGIAAHQTMFRELMGVASEKEVEELREALADKADRD